MMSFFSAPAATQQCPGAARRRTKPEIEKQQPKSKKDQLSLALDDALRLRFTPTIHAYAFTFLR